MTPADLCAWQAAMGYNRVQAAAALGMTVSNYKDLALGKRRMTGKPILVLDKRTELACAALSGPRT